MVSYEEQVTTIREQLAELLEDEEDWAKAAKVLAGIDLDSGPPLMEDCLAFLIHLAYIFAPFAHRAHGNRPQKLA